MDVSIRGLARGRAFSADSSWDRTSVDIPIDQFLAASDRIECRRRRRRRHRIITTRRLLPTAAPRSSSSRPRRHVGKSKGSVEHRSASSRIRTCCAPRNIGYLPPRVPTQVVRPASPHASRRDGDVVFALPPPGHRLGLLSRKLTRTKLRRISITRLVRHYPTDTEWRVYTRILCLCTYKYVRNTSKTYV